MPQTEPAVGLSRLAYLQSAVLQWFPRIVVLGSRFALMCVPARAGTLQGWGARFPRKAHGWQGLSRSRSQSPGSRHGTETGWGGERVRWVHEAATQNHGVGVKLACGAGSDLFARFPASCSWSGERKSTPAFPAESRSRSNSSSSRREASLGEIACAMTRSRSSKFGWVYPRSQKRFGDLPPKSFNSAPVVTRNCTDWRTRARLIALENRCGFAVTRIPSRICSLANLSAASSRRFCSVKSRLRIPCAASTELPLSPLCR